MIIAASVVLGMWNRALAAVLCTFRRPHVPKCSGVVFFFTFRSANQALNSSVHFLPTTFPDRAAELRKQRPILRRPQEPHYPKKRRVLHPRVVSPVNLRASERLHFPTTNYLIMGGWHDGVVELMMWLTWVEMLTMTTVRNSEVF